MLLKRFIRLAMILSVVVLAASAEVSAQSQTGNSPAQKFDDFGDIEASDKKARLDNFAVALANEPNARAFIIVYRSRRDLPGLNSRAANWMRDYLVNARVIPPQRVVTVDGGEADCLRHEFWLVPVGATPTPRSDAYPQYIDVTAVRKFDEYYYPLLKDQPESGGSDGDSLGSFAAALRREPRSQAYLILYPQYYVERWGEEGNVRGRMHRRVYQDSPLTAAKVLRSLKAEMVNRHHIAPSRVKVVNGGYRKLRQVELWIVPRGEHPPVATPNAFPQKRAQVKR